MGMYMAIKLHCFGESGNAYKAALTLELAGINWSPVYVDFFGGAARSDGYRDLNIMAEAPILVQGDFSLSQSGAIQQWVVDQTGNLGGSPEDKYEVLRWVLFDNHKMSSQAGMTRFLMNFLPEDKRPLEVIKFMQGRVLGALKILDTHLESRSWIVGNTMTIADIANCGYLFYPEPYGFTRANWSNIDSWLSRIEATKGWKHPYDLMPGNPSDRV
jgi:glutathione S-transferase|tara:strand:- start:2 stop:646 length:645 start_codon:yes stop_codon:yes gene_type:complete